MCSTVLRDVKISGNTPNIQRAKTLITPIAIILELVL